MGLLSRDEEDRTGTPEQPLTDALRELEEAPRALPGAPENSWQDHTHSSLYLELLDPSGAVVGRAKWTAPANANAQAPHSVRAVIAHEDGCSRDLATWDIPPY